jgi:hypothetical protein
MFDPIFLLMANNQFRDNDDNDIEDLLQVQNMIYCLYLMKEEVEDELVLTALGALTLIDQMARDVRNEFRSQHHQNLLCSDLIRNPRGNTPWQMLYQAQNPQSFITTMVLCSTPYARLASICHSIHVCVSPILVLP